MRRILLLLLCLAMLTPCAVQADTSSGASAPALDVLAITIDPDALWNAETGLFTVGNDVDKSQGAPYKGTVYSTQVGTTRAATLAYYPAGTDERAATEHVQISLIAGYYSLDLAQKSLLVRADDGAFEGFPLTGAVLELSNGNMDGMFTRIAEGLQTTLLQGLADNALHIPDWKPVVVTINGEYWGHYNLRQVIDAQAICQLEGVPADQAESITIINSSQRAVQGDATAYNAMISLLAHSSPNTNADDRAYLDENIDAESYLNWFAAAIYFGDASSSDVRYYRVPGRQWKCIAKPSSFGLFQSNFNSPKSYTDPKGMTAADLDNTVFLKLLEVDEYRALFLTKLGSFYQAMTTEVMQSTLDACVAQIEAEMPAHFERWAALNEPAILAEAPTDPEAALEYWQARITRMRDGTMVRRPYYIYTYTQEVFSLTDAEMQTYFGGPRPAAPEE